MFCMPVLNVAFGAYSLTRCLLEPSERLVQHISADCISPCYIPRTACNHNNPNVANSIAVPQHSTRKWFEPTVKRMLAIELCTALTAATFALCGIDYETSRRIWQLRSDMCTWRSYAAPGVIVHSIACFVDLNLP